MNLGCQILVTLSVDKNNYLLDTNTLYYVYHLIMFTDADIDIGINLGPSVLLGIHHWYSSLITRSLLGGYPINGFVHFPIFYVLQQKAHVIFNPLIIPVYNCDM